MSYDIIREDVPPFVKRVGDHVVQGSNNTIIVLGTDRARRGPAGLADGLGHVGAPDGGRGAGAVHVIAGRRDPAGNPDMDADAAFVYLSMDTEVDVNLGLGQAGGDVGRSSAGVIKADAVRVVARRDLKLSIDGGSAYIVLSKDGVTVEAPQIRLGRGAKKHLVRYEDMETFFDSHVHLSAAPNTPTGTPVVPMASQRLNIMTKTGNEILVSG